MIAAYGEVRSGSDILMGPACFIWTANHDYSVDNMFRPRVAVHKPVVIEDNVWIAANVKIAPGVAVGTGSVLAMGAVATRDGPPYTVIPLES